jgi:hypothetical protein
MSDFQSEIEAFFAGATMWDYVITAVVILIMWKFVKKLLFIGILIAVGYYLFTVYGK